MPVVLTQSKNIDLFTALGSFTAFQQMRGLRLFPEEIGYA
jgi:hypothetical protein